MKRKIGLMALTIALTAALAACGSTAENPDPSAPAVAPTASPNTVTKGLEDTARGAVNDVGRAAQNAGNAMQSW